MRELLYRRYWDRVREERARLRAGVAGRVNLRSPNIFIDYSIGTPGTVPEKMLYRVLQDKRVNFYFAYFFGDIPFTTDRVERIRPDFILPDYNIIVEVQGAYWHSQKGSWERDYLRALWLKAAGWDVITITDYDLLHNPYGALEEAIPQLLSPPIVGKAHTGFRPSDPTASLRAQRQRWPRAHVATFGSINKGAWFQTATKFRAVGSKVSHGIESQFPLFSSSQIDVELAQQYAAYGEQWRKYIEDLGEGFKQNPSWWYQYPDIGKYYNRWKDWWTRFGRTG